jgi:molybdopterin molybdotransferase
MLPALEAESLILDLVAPFSPERDQETVSLSDGLGRILAEPIVSPLDFPHWDNSAMDGYAVRAADVAQAPTWLDIIEEIPAGKPPTQSLQPGQAARIFTGSMLPAGADTVVMQEETTRTGDKVQILSIPTPRAFVRHQGSFRRVGDPLLAPGTAIRAPELGLLAAAQCLQLQVYRRPRIAILSTGDELVEPHQPLKPGQIVDSNQYMLEALVTQLGAQPLRLGIVRDNPEMLRQTIANALSTADLIVSSGGVSVGDYDYVDQILAELGATVHIRAVAVRPGKPLTVATFSGAIVSGSMVSGSMVSGSMVSGSNGAQSKSLLYFGLPGNPASSLVSFWRFVQPAIRKLSGLKADWQPSWVIAQPTQTLHTDGKRETYLWGQLQPSNSGYQFAPMLGGHNSGNLVNLVQTTGLAMIPVGTTEILPNQSVQVMVIR